MTRVQRENEGGSAKSVKLKKSVKHGNFGALEAIGFACLMTRVQELECTHGNQ